MAKTYAFTDIHGMYDLWAQIKDYCAEDDTIYFLGDACDRGPDGVRIMKELLAAPRVIYLKGNHEDMMIEELTTLLNGQPLQSHWMTQGGNTTLDSLLLETDRELMNLYYSIQNLPTCALYTNTKGEDIYLSHSGFYSPCGQDRWKRYNYPNIEQAYLWDRHVLQHTNWSPKHPNVYCVHGHSPVQIIFNKEEPVVYCESHRVDLDTAPYATNSIYLYDLDERKIEAVFKTV